jgi:hypothetical protein
MTTLREAARQALEALFEINWSNDSRWQADRAETVIPALRAALAQEDETQKMLRTLGFDHQCPESIGVTLRRWKDGYAAALAQEEPWTPAKLGDALVQWVDASALAQEDDPHPPSRHCMCDACKPAFEPTPGAEPIRPTVQEMQNAAANLKLMKEMFGGSTALAQEEQEPVAWMFQHKDTGRKNYVSNDGCNGPGRFLVMNPRYTLVSALYTAPPRREWRGLTMQEINALPEVGGRMWNMGSAVSVLRAIRAVEAALKEKNNG